jgi:hypothetical protein
MALALDLAASLMSSEVRGKHIWEDATLHPGSPAIGPLLEEALNEMAGTHASIPGISA